MDCHSGEFNYVAMVGRGGGGLNRRKKKKKHGHAIFLGVCAHRELIIGKTS